MCPLQVVPDPRSISTSSWNIDPTNFADGFKTWQPLTISPNKGSGLPTAIRWNQRFGLMPFQCYHAEDFVYCKKKWEVFIVPGPMLMCHWSVSWTKHIDFTREILLEDYLVKRRKHLCQKKRVLHSHRVLSYLHHSFSGLPQGKWFKSTKYMSV